MDRTAPKTGVSPAASISGSRLLSETEALRYEALGFSYDCLLRSCAIVSALLPIAYYPTSHGEAPRSRWTSGCFSSLPLQVQRNNNNTDKHNYKNNNNYYYVIIVIIISSSSNSFHLRHAAPSHREAQQPVSKHLAVCAESVSSDE